MNGVILPVITEYDGKGFKQAEKGLDHLTKSATKLLGSLALAHKAQKAMLSYIADEKATKVLAQNLKNLGLAYAIPSAETFIKNMETQTGILDDELRPAYAQLARVTGSTIESQKLMALAFDVSSGTGKDYASVIDALSQAYVGNNKGLKQLNIGLTQAELKTKSFAEISAILNKQFAGSGAASLDSYAGKMALLQVASANASETIGKGLLDAITQASGPGGFPAFIKGIQSAANTIVDLVTGTSRLIALIDVVASPSKGPADILKKYRALRAKWDAEDLQVQKERSGIANNTSSYFEKQAKDSILAAKIAKTQKTLAAQQLATQKKLTAEKRAQIAIDKANAALNTANNVFDLERIGVAAALQNKSLNEDEVKRLELKQKIFELEDAIASKNTELIEELTRQLEALTKQTTQLNANFQALQNINGLLNQIGYGRELFNNDSLTTTIGLLSQITGMKQTASSVSALIGDDPNLAKAILVDAVNAFQEEVVVPDLSSMYNLPTGTTSTTSSPTVVVQITENAQKLIDMITFETQNTSANGEPIALYRNATNLAW